MWKRVRSFFRGWRERHSGMTTKYSCASRQQAYDNGRYWGQRLSLFRN